MQKKKMCGLLVCLLAFVATNAFGQYWGDDGDFSYTGDAGVITITGYIGSDADIVLPDTIIGMPVTAIAINAFRENTGLTTVVIPEGITDIGALAFANCTGLTDVTIPSTVTVIGGSAFSGCESLTSLTIPEGVEAIPGSLAQGCIALTSVTIPESALTIGASAFKNCTALTSVTIPEFVTTLSTSAFQYSGLTSVYIPANVTSIAQGTALSGCAGLTGITVDEANATYSSVDGVLYDKAQTKLLQYPGGIEYGDVSVPNGVKEILNTAFKECLNVGSVTLPSGLTTIWNNAFQACSLTSVNIPASVTSIKNQAFLACPNLTGIDVDAANAIYSSADGVMYNKAQTQLLQHPAGQSSVTILDTVTTLGANVFAQSLLLTSVSIPASVTSINANAFRGCINLTGFVVDPANPSFSSLDGVIYNKAGTTLVMCPEGKAAVTIPEGVTAIGNNAFQWNGLITSLVIPEGVTSIGLAAFYEANALTSSTIPDSVTTFTGQTFYGCDSLTSVAIGSGLATIGMGAFWECKSLVSIDVDPANPNFSSNDGVLFNQAGTTLIQFPGGKAGAYSIPEGVTLIEASSFRSNTAITSLSIPGSVTSTGNYAFFNCTSLASVDIADGADGFGTGAFNGCTSLTSVTLPASITAIPVKMFNGNWHLSSVYFLGDAPTVANNDAFGGLAADFHVCYAWNSIGFLNPWNGLRAYPISICDDPQGDNDEDGTPNYLDNCLNTANPAQTDYDNDTLGDACDNCPDVSNYKQQDTCGDGTGDACNPDSEGDGFPDVCDNCPVEFNPEQGDIDNDGIGNVCEEGPPCYVNVEIQSDPYQATEMLDDNCNGIADDHECAEAGYLWNGEECVLDNPPEFGIGPFLAAGTWPLLPISAEGPMYLNQNASVLWTFSDDYGSCSGDCTHVAEYQAVGESTWTALAVSSDRAQGYAWVNLPIDQLENATTYAFRFTVTDCAGQTTQSGEYYFRVAVTDAPPVIEAGPFLAAGSWPMLATSTTRAAVLMQNEYVLWTFSDDYASCSGLCTHRARYKNVDSGDWIWTYLPVSTDPTGKWYAQAELPVESLAAGTYMFYFDVRDCAGQLTKASKVYYFKVAAPQ